MGGLLKACKFIGGNKRYVFSATPLNDDLSVYCCGIAKTGESRARIGIVGLNCPWVLPVKFYVQRSCT